MDWRTEVDNKIKSAVKVVDEKHVLMYKNHGAKIHEIRESYFGNGKTGTVTEVDRLIQARNRMVWMYGLIVIALGTTIGNIVINYIANH